MKTDQLLIHIMTLLMFLLFLFSFSQQYRSRSNYKNSCRFLEKWKRSRRDDAQRFWKFHFSYSFQQWSKWVYPYVFIIHHLRWSSFLLKISLCRRFFKVNFDWQLSGWCFHPIPASGVQTCCTVCDGCDERQRSSARWKCGRPGGQKFSLLPQTGASICHEWLQDSST